LAVISTTVHASTTITGTIASKKVAEKYSLKNLSSLSHKATTFHDLKSSLVYKGLTVHANMNGASNQTTYLKYNKGNISYVIPYKHKLILPRFKTPSPQQP
jgi:subtilase family serine protease